MMSILLLMVMIHLDMPTYMYVLWFVCFVFQGVKIETE